MARRSGRRGTKAIPAIGAGHTFSSMKEAEEWLGDLAREDGRIIHRPEGDQMIPSVLFTCRNASSSGPAPLACPLFVRLGAVPDSDVWLVQEAHPHHNMACFQQATQNEARGESQALPNVRFLRLPLMPSSAAQDQGFTCHAVKHEQGLGSTAAAAVNVKQEEGLRKADIDVKANPFQTAPKTELQALPSTFFGVPWAVHFAMLRAGVKSEEHFHENTIRLRLRRIEEYVDGLQKKNPISDNDAFFGVIRLKEGLRQRQRDLHMQQITIGGVEVMLIDD